jgi:hypothetical protein
VALLFKPSPESHRGRPKGVKLPKIYRPRGRISPFQEQYDILAQDPVIQNYIADLARTGKKPSHHTKVSVYQAWTVFLQRLGAAITPSSAWTLTEWKKANPQSNDLERAIKLWKAEANTTGLRYIARILGTFCRWSKHSQLDVSVHCSSQHQTIPIAEPILLSIYSELDQRDKDALDLMFYGAERIYALGHVELSKVILVENSNVALLEISAQNAKNGVQHPSMIPRQLAERLLQEAQENGYACLMPNIRSRWRRISKLAKERYHVILTSHYLRKLFETRCEKIPSNTVNPNHWTILMGEQPKLGHMPSIYSLMQDREILEEYEKEILPRLTLISQKTPPTETEQLRQENAELEKQLLTLTKLLTEKLTAP